MGEGILDLDPPVNHDRRQVVSVEVGGSSQTPLPASEPRFSGCLFPFLGKLVLVTPNHCPSTAEEFLLDSAQDHI